MQQFVAIGVLSTALACGSAPPPAPAPLPEPHVPPTAPLASQPAPPPIPAPSPRPDSIEPIRPSLDPDSRWARWQLPLAGSMLADFPTQEQDQGGAEFVHPGNEDLAAVMGEYRRHFKSLGFRECEVVRSSGRDIYNMCRERRPDCATVTITLSDTDAGAIAADRGVVASLYYVDLECAR